MCIKGLVLSFVSRLSLLTSITTFRPHTAGPHHPIDSVNLQSQTICTTVVVSDWCIKIQNCKKNNYFIANGFKKN